jgi:hypothetical protein
MIRILCCFPAGGCGRWPNDILSLRSLFSPCPDKSASVGRRARLWRSFPHDSRPGSQSAGPGLLTWKSSTDPTRKQHGQSFPCQSPVTNEWPPFSTSVQCYKTSLARKDFIEGAILIRVLFIYCVFSPRSYPG